MYNKYSQKQTLILILCLSVFIMLSGCGGGGDSEAAAPIAPTVDQNDEPVVDINTLVAAPDFSFTTKSDVTVNLNIEQYQDQRSVINIYRQYQLLDTGDYYPKTASRVVSGPLINGHFSQSFIGLNQQTQYLVEVWSFDGSPPLQRELTVTNNQLNW